MPSLYKIISEGRPHEGEDRNQVIERISARFKMDLGKAARLVSGKAIVLKSGLDHVPSSAKEPSASYLVCGAWPSSLSIFFSMLSSLPLATVKA